MNSLQGLIKADAREIPLRDECVQTCVTSPPYWGLRDYGIPPSIWDGDPEHEHVFGELLRRKGGAGNQGINGQRAGRSSHEASRQHGQQQGQFCECGAWRGCLGLEPTYLLYVEHMVQVFREVWLSLIHI